MPNPPNSDNRIPKIIAAAESLADGQFNVEVPVLPPDEIGRLGQTIRDLGQALETRYREAQHLADITARINAGLLLDEVLEGVYRDFSQFIPYDRIGFALLEEGGRVLRARWAKSKLPAVKLHRGYSAIMAGSSLQTIIATGQPRILNDLVVYLSEKPNSQSTRLMVEEGIRSSLTCPLVANGLPVGFMFFSSARPNTYATAHAKLFMQIAEQLSVMVEKGRLVSELAGQKAEIESQNEELRRLSEVKNSFLGIAAHDLRNPLTTIQLTTGFLLNREYDVPEEDRRSLLQEADRQVAYMLSLLYDLLDVSHIESGKLSLNAEAIQLDTFLADTARRHARLAEPKNIQIKLEPVPSGQVYADPLRFRQVLDNLISNAVKFTPPSHSVHVTAQVFEAEWRISIKDEGPGLTAEDRGKLFQDFARLSARPTGGEKSTGLGLAITRRVVEAHGGRIGADSEPGQGATFWFTLPVADGQSAHPK